MIKLITAIFLTFTSLITFASEDCEFGDRKSFYENWRMFLDVSTKGKPSEIERFYHFPIKLFSPTDTKGKDEKPVLISKSFFRKNYTAVFEGYLPEIEREVFRELKKEKDRVLTEGNIIDQNGCIRIKEPALGNYKFIWSRQNGWQITSIIYIDYGDLEMEMRKKYLK